MSLLTPRSSSKVLAATALACGLLAAPATADVPSLDAYAGQALVLGRPHAHHAHGRRGGGAAAVTLPSATNARNGGTGEPSSGGGESPSRGEATPGSGAPPASTHPGGAAPRVAAPGRSNAAGRASSTGARSRHPSAPMPAPAAVRGQLAGSSMPLGSLDIALIVIGVVALIAMTAMMRRLRRASR